MMAEYKGHIKEKGDNQSNSDHSISAVINRSALDIASDPILFYSSVSSLASGRLSQGLEKGMVNAKELA